MNKFLISLISFITIFSVTFAQVEYRPSDLVLRHGDFLAKVLGANELQDILMAVDSETNQAQFEKQIFDQLYRLNQRGMLESSILRALQKSKILFNYAPLLKISEQEITSTLVLVILSELHARGYYNTPPLKPWAQIYQEQMIKVASLPSVPYFNSIQFKQAFKRLTGSDFLSTKELKIVSQNVEAFDARINLIKQAEKEIYISVWGFYDDSTGTRIADALIEAQSRGVAVRLIVDGITARRSGYHYQLQRLEQNGVEVIYWKSSTNPFFGMHAKFIVIDRNISLEGGRNIGDFYLKDNNWTDLDLLHNGNVGKQNYNLFVALWNRQVSLQKLDFDVLRPIQIVNDTLATQEQTATIMHFANPEGVDPIYETTLYAISQAKKQISIANAYIINTPGMKEYLKNAILRGVKVTIMSNSPQSIDEPMISIPIVRSLKELSVLGATVYFKQGSTLHTKLMTVDDDFAWVGSYNLHPRSFHYEVEKVFVTLRKSQVESLNLEFKNLISVAKKMRPTDNWGVPDQTPYDLFFLLFFNQL